MSSRGKTRPVTINVLLCKTLVKVLVFEILEGKAPRPLFSKEKALSKNWQGTDRELYAAITSSVYQLLHEGEKFLQKNVSESSVSRVVFFYTPPFAIYGNEQISIHSPKQTELDTKTLENAVLEAKKRFAAGYRRNIKETTGGSVSRLAVVTEKLSFAVLDGYPVSDFLSRSYKSFSAELSLEAVPADMLQKLMDVAHSLFHYAELSHLTVRHAVLDVLAQTQTHPQNFLLCTIFPHASSLYSVENKIATRQILFPYGTDHILGAIAKKLSTTRTVAHSHALLYRDQKLHNTAEGKFSEALKEVGNEWTKQFTLARQKLSERFTLAKSVFILSFDWLDIMLFTSIPSLGLDSCGEYTLTPLSSTSFGETLTADSQVQGNLEVVLMHYLSHAHDGIDTVKGGYAIL